MLESHAVAKVTKVGSVFAGTKHSCKIQPRTVKIPRMLPALHSPLVGLACAASAPGLTDLQYLARPYALWPYALVPAPLPAPATAVAFGISSVVHFGADIGLCASFGLHAVLVALAAWRVTAASTVACLYYLLVHVPRHIAARWPDPSAKCAVLAGLLLLPFTFRLRQYRLHDASQRLVIAHTLVQLMQNKAAK